MLTRVISGAVLILVVGGMFVLGNFFPLVLAAFIAIVASIGVYEILNNTGIIKKKIACIGGSAFAFINVFSLLSYTQKLWSGLSPIFFTVIYAVFVVAISLKFNKEFGLNSIAAALSFPIIISYAFSTIASLYFRENGLFYLLHSKCIYRQCQKTRYHNPILLFRLPFFRLMNKL